MKNRSDTRPAARAIRSATAQDLEREFYNAEAVIRENMQPIVKDTPRQEKGRSTKPRKI
jgi:hypothetical protein